MQSIKNLEYQQCRSCYDSTNNLQLLTSVAESSLLVVDKTYAQLLLDVCNINVMNDKPLGRWPQFICYNCSRKLILAYDFIQHSLKINKLLQSIADLLQIGSESDFIENPALDIPPEIKCEKEDYLDLTLNERKFQYSPVEVEGTKVSNLQSREICGCLPRETNIPKHKTNNKISDDEYIQEIFVPSAIEFISNDMIKDDLEKFHRRIINNIDNKKQNDDTNLACLEDDLLCVPEPRTSKPSADVVCNESFPNAWKLNRHKSFNHSSEDNKTYCTICSQNFARPYNYKRHIANVHKRKVIKHQQTKHIYKKKKIIQHLNSTEKIKSNDKLEDVTCNICKKIFRDQRRLARHQRYTHLPEEEKITCHFCGNKFSRPDNYQTHMNRMHNTSHIKPSTDNFQSRFLKHSCDKCGRTYSRRSLLHRHERNVHATK